MNLICILFGHKKYRARCWGGHAMIECNDQLGSPLIDIELCDRCGAVYWERVTKATRENEDEQIPR